MGFRIGALALVLMAGWQVFATTAFAVPLCRMRPEPVTCHCPHRKAAAKPEATLRQGTCCEHPLVRANTAPALPDSWRVTIAPAAALAPAWLVSEPPRAEAFRPFAWSVSPPSHGPPLYLSLRTLLN